jgi:hypothetical protein
MYIYIYIYIIFNDSLGDLLIRRGCPQSVIEFRV